MTITTRLARNLRAHQLGSDANAHHARTQRLRFRVVRRDGAVLGGASTLDRAERMADCIRTGQRADYAVVMTRGQS